MAELPTDMRNLLSMLNDFDPSVFKETCLTVQSPLEMLRIISQNKISFSQRYVSLNQHF